MIYQNDLYTSTPGPPPHDRHFSILSQKKMTTPHDENDDNSKTRAPLSLFTYKTVFSHFFDCLTSWLELAMLPAPPPPPPPPPPPSLLLADDEWWRDDADDDDERAAFAITVSGGQLLAVRACSGIKMGLSCASIRSSAGVKSNSGGSASPFGRRLSGSRSSS